MLGGQARGAFAAGAEVVQRLEGLAAERPVRSGTHVAGLVPDGDGYVLQTSDEVLQARAVVVATGDQNVPRVPPVANTLPDWIAQQHTAVYRGAGSLPAGGVLVGAAPIPVVRSLRICCPRVGVSSSRRVRRDDCPGDTAAGTVWNGWWTRASTTSGRKTFQIRR